VRITVSSASARRGLRGTPYRADHCDMFRRPAWFRSRSALPPAKRAASTADRAAVVLPAPSIPVRTISRGDSFRRGESLFGGATAGRPGAAINFRLSLLQRRTGRGCPRPALPGRKGSGLTSAGPRFSGFPSGAWSCSLLAVRISRAVNGWVLAWFFRHHLQEGIHHG
jgi:hypothetical protein